MSHKKISDKNGSSKTLIIVAVIGLLGTMVAAFFGVLANTKPTEITINATQTAEAKLALPSPPILLSGKIPFSSFITSNGLNADLQWDAGNSELSLYTLSADAITLTAGPHTWPNFPKIYYKQPIEGNFEAQVKVTFSPSASKLSTAQMVGLVVRPINARLVSGDTSFPMDWIVAAKSITDAGSLVGCRGSWEEYSVDTVYLKMERDNNIWRCAYSKNGENWTWLRVQGDYQPLNDQQMEMALFAYSETDDSITVEFSDWFITRR